MIYFASTDQIKKITGTADSLSDEKIRSCVYLAQTSHVLPMLGFSLYDYIGSLIAAGQLGTFETELIEEYLQPILAWHTMAMVVTQGNTQTEIGTGHQSDISPEDNPYRIKNSYAKIGNAYITRANEWLCKVRFPFYEEKEFNHQGSFFGINIENSSVSNRTRRQEMFYRKSKGN